MTQNEYHTFVAPPASHVTATSQMGHGGPGYSQPGRPAAGPSYHGAAQNWGGGYRNPTPSAAPRGNYGAPSHASTPHPSPGGGFHMSGGGGHKR
jgi:hypothetical protein